jgi:two-component system, OmpR family, sensor kinase
VVGDGAGVTASDVIAARSGGVSHPEPLVVHDGVVHDQARHRVGQDNPGWRRAGWAVAVAASVLPGLIVMDTFGFGWGAPLTIVLPAAAAVVAFERSDRRARRLSAEMAVVQQRADERADLVAAVSHDVRTPLAMVRIAADLLIQGGPGEINDRQRRFLTTISDQSQQAIAIAEDLLTQAKIEAGRFSARFEPADLNRVVTETVRGLRPMAEQRDQRIVTDLPQLPPLITVDERLIRRAIVNLSTNAMRFTTKGGMIVVRLLANDDSAVICVTDDGAGMTQEAREKLFRPFASGSTLADGTGLGLVLTKQIALLHGGKLLVDTKPQQGTTIMMRIPHRRNE